MSLSPFEYLTQPLAFAPWAKRWLMLGVLSLALAGIFSIILVISRTPQLIAHVPELGKLFHVSLVVHVDLSVLVWFLAIGGMAWAWLRAWRGSVNFPFFDITAFTCLLAGMLCIALSPLTGEWEVIKSNYIPVMTNLVFFIGLALVMAAIVIAILHTLPVLFTASDVREPEDTRLIGWGILGSVIITAVAVAAFIASHSLMPVTLTGLAYYETVFWGGGHILQFTYTQLMLVAWSVLALALGLSLPAIPMRMLIFAIGPFFALMSFIPYALIEVTDQLHMDFFTLQMNVAGGVSGVVLGVYLLISLLRAESTPRDLRALKASLLMSLILFAVGGLFGAFIHGPNVRIPAHYHGATVAVTLALMGLAYAILPAMGGKHVANWRMARLQPYLYGGGQLLHITGLAISGGYGVLRKTVGDVGDGGWEVKAALGMMGGGGLLAIIGGLFFVIVMAKGFRAPKTKDLPS
jgi:cytochrome c oxidase subunit 1